MSLLTFLLFVVKVYAFMGFFILSKKQPVFFFSDNHAAHHIPQVEQIIRNTGAHILYLPTYSPELNPIEGMFSLSKGYIRANDDLYMASPVTDMMNLIYESFLDVSLETIQTLYQHC